MHEFQYQLEPSIHDLHTSRQKLPLNFAIREVQQVCVNKYIYIREKGCNMTCYIHTTSKRECGGQEFRVET